MSRTLRSGAHKALIEEIRRARSEAGQTQQAVADTLGRPQSYVAKIEVGERSIDVVELLEMLDVLGADWKDVVARVDIARRRP